MAGANTRRYHGLLVAATLPPVGRVVALSRYSEVLQVGDDADAGRHDLSAVYFRDDLVGDGADLLRRFRIERETAKWEYDVAGTKIYKQVLVCWEHNSVGVRYRVVAGRGTPRQAAEPHTLAVRGDAGLPQPSPHRRGRVRPGGRPQLRQRAAARFATEPLALRPRRPGKSDGECGFEDAPDWWYGHSYPMETARGLDDREDLYTPGTYTL